jgi:D-glycero-alpha-D-manno-heptose-7-phosphate kinase
MISFVMILSVPFDSIICPPKTKRDIESHLMLFYTGRTRKSSDILSKQKTNSKINKDVLDKMRDQAERLFHDLTSLQVNKLGQALKEGWELKKSLAKGISDPEIDKMYEKALKAGALGEKLTQLSKI